MQFLGFIKKHCICKHKCIEESKFILWTFNEHIQTYSNIPSNYISWNVFSKKIHRWWLHYKVIIWKSWQFQITRNTNTCDHFIIRMTWCRHEIKKYCWWWCLDLHKASFWQQTWYFGCGASKTLYAKWAMALYGTVFVKGKYIFFKPGLYFWHKIRSSTHW